jgi:hypothetical protein
MVGGSECSASETVPFKLILGTEVRKATFLSRDFLFYVVITDASGVRLEQSNSAPQYWHKDNETVFHFSQLCLKIRIH